MRPIKSVPPARATELGPPKSRTASSTVAGAAYSKAFMRLRSPFSGGRGQGIEHVAGSHRPVGHADADRVGHRVADRGRRGNRRGLADADHSASLLIVGLVRPDNDLGNV